MKLSLLRISCREELEEVEEPEELAGCLAASQTVWKEKKKLCWTLLDQGGETDLNKMFDGTNVSLLGLSCHLPFFPTIHPSFNFLLN